jgi:hypothetical protein
LQCFLGMKNFYKIFTAVSCQTVLKCCTL